MIITRFVHVMLLLCGLSRGGREEQLLTSLDRIRPAAAAYQQYIGRIVLCHSGNSTTLDAFDVATRSFPPVCRDNSKSQLHYTSASDLASKLKDISRIVCLKAPTEVAVCQPLSLGLDVLRAELLRNPTSRQLLGELSLHHNHSVFTSARRLHSSCLAAVTLALNARRFLPQQMDTLQSLPSPGGVRWAWVVAEGYAAGRAQRDQWIQSQNHSQPSGYASTRRPELELHGAQSRGSSPQSGANRLGLSSDGTTEWLDSTANYMRNAAIRGSVAHDRGNKGVMAAVRPPYHELARSNWLRTHESRNAMGNRNGNRARVTTGASGDHNADLLRAFCRKWVLKPPGKRRAAVGGDSRSTVRWVAPGLCVPVLAEFLLMKASLHANKDISLSSALKKRIASALEEWQGLVSSSGDVLRVVLRGLTGAWADKRAMMNAATWTAMDMMAESSVGRCTLLQLDADESWSPSSLLAAARLGNSLHRRGLGCAMVPAHQVISPALTQSSGAGNSSGAAVAVPLSRFQELAAMAVQARRQCQSDEKQSALRVLHSGAQEAATDSTSKSVSCPWYRRTAWGSRRHQEWARVFALQLQRHAVWVSHAPPVLAVERVAIGGAPVDRSRVSKSHFEWSVSGPALAGGAVDPLTGVTPQQGGCLPPEISLHRFGLQFTHHAHSSRKELARKMARYGYDDGDSLDLDALRREAIKREATIRRLLLCPCEELADEVSALRQTLTPLLLHFPWTHRQSAVNCDEAAVPVPATLAALVNFGNFADLPDMVTSKGIHQMRSRHANDVAPDGGNTHWQIGDGCPNDITSCRGPYLSRQGAVPATCRGGISRVWCSTVPQSIAALPAGSSVRIQFDGGSRISDNFDGWPFALHDQNSDPLLLARAVGNTVTVDWGRTTSSVTPEYSLQLKPAVITDLRACGNGNVEQVKCRRPRVSIVHDLTPERLGWPKQSCERNATAASTRHSTAIISASPSTAADILAYLRQGNTTGTRPTCAGEPTVLASANGVNSWAYSPDWVVAASRIVGALAAEAFQRPKLAESMRSLLQSGRKFVLLVGPQRGYKMGAAAMAAFCSRESITSTRGGTAAGITGLALVYIGRDAAGVKAMLGQYDAGRCGSVVFVPPDAVLAGDTALPALMRLAHATVTLAVHEGFGLLVAETCAVGGRVLVTDSPSSRWLARQAGCSESQVLAVLPGLKHTRTSAWPPTAGSQEGLSIGNADVERIWEAMHADIHEKCGSSGLPRGWELMARAVATALVLF